MSLEEHIIGFECYKKKFSSWEPEEIIIDKKRAYWSLRRPGTENEKVCLYRDGSNMFIYGDYGHFTFNKMTWLGSVYNLEYDNIEYQIGKMSYESKKSAFCFDESKCEKDIRSWLECKLEYEYKDKAKVVSDKICDFIESNIYITDFEIEDFETEDFETKNELFDLIDLIKFVKELYEHIDEYEWIAHLRETNLGDFDEECESSLWDAGKTISQCYFICLYALRVCKEKLEARKEKCK